MGSHDTVSGTPRLRFSVRVFDIQHLHFNVHTAHTLEAVVIFGPMSHIHGLGGTIKITGDHNFACLDETDSYCTFELIRVLSQFQRMKDGKWHIVTHKQLDSGRRSISDGEVVNVDLSFIGTRYC